MLNLVSLDKYFFLLKLVGKDYYVFITFLTLNFLKYGLNFLVSFIFTIYPFG